MNVLEQTKHWTSNAHEYIFVCLSNVLFTNNPRKVALYSKSPCWSRQLVSVLAHLIADNTPSNGRSVRYVFVLAFGFHAVETTLLVKPFRRHKQLLGMLF